MSNKNIPSNLKFIRRVDKAVYCFHPCEPINGKIAWKREDIDLWITQVEGFGWVCIDSHDVICGIPWGVPLNKVSKYPPACEWVSKKDDKSYVYDVVYMD